MYLMKQDSYRHQMPIQEKPKVDTSYEIIQSQMSDANARETERKRTLRNKKDTGVRCKRKRRYKQTYLTKQDSHRRQKPTQQKPIIFHFLWDHWADCGIFEDGVLPIYTQESISSVANFITADEESQ